MAALPAVAARSNAVGAGGGTSTATAGRAEAAGTLAHIINASGTAANMCKRYRDRRARACLCEVEGKLMGVGAIPTIVGRTPEGGCTLVLGTVLSVERLMAED